VNNGIAASIVVGPTTDEAKYIDGFTCGTDFLVAINTLETTPRAKLCLRRFHAASATNPPAAIVLDNDTAWDGIKLDDDESTVVSSIEVMVPFVKTVGSAKVGEN